VTSSSHFQVFDGPDEFLDPAKLPPVPLIKLPPELVPFPPKERVSIYAQAAYRWPLGNLKHPAVFSMLYRAKTEGRFERIHTVTESSSGNTAYCVAKLACQFKIAHVKLFVPGDIPSTKEKRLRELDVELTKCYDRPGEPSAIQQACMAGQESGHFYLGQYGNDANVIGHKNYHLKPAWEQTRGMMKIYCAGMGTAGTIRAAIEFSKNDAPIEVVAALCAPDNPVPGLRTKQRLEEVPLAQPVMDPESDGVVHRAEVLRTEAFSKSWKLAKKNINAGPSSGSAYAALLTFLAKSNERAADWENLRNNDGEIVAVFMCGDPFDLYDIEKYTTILDPDAIPA